MGCDGAGRDACRILTASYAAIYLEHMGACGDAVQLVTGRCVCTCVPHDVMVHGVVEWAIEIIERQCIKESWLPVSVELIVEIWVV